MYITYVIASLRSLLRTHDEGIIEPYECMNENKDQYEE
jgi:hypothetical protein